MENSISNFWGYSNQWRLMLLLGILTVACGIWFFIEPEIAYVLIAVLFGFSMLIGGIVQLITASINKEADGRVWLIIMGIFEMILVFILVANIGFTEEALPFVFSFIVFFEGVFSIISSSKMYGTYKTWWIYLINGIILIALSAFFFLSPFSTVFTIVFVASFMMIYRGITQIFLAIDLRPRD